jgi:DNA uptake protein ComE-like DNA-binding protein
MPDKVNLNTASRQQLNSIPNIGDECVDRIMKNRPFDDMKQVDKVTGFGDDALQNLHEHATV